MGNSQTLFNSLFKKNIGGDTVSWLQQLTEEHPYFTAAQFYLLQQQSTNDAGYADQARKTSALFNNGYWLSYQLNQSGQPTDIVPELQPPAATVTQLPAETVFTGTAERNETIGNGQTEPVEHEALENLEIVSQSQDTDQPEQSIPDNEFAATEALSTTDEKPVNAVDISDDVNDMEPTDLSSISPMVDQQEEVISITNESTDTSRDQSEMISVNEENATIVNIAEPDTEAANEAASDLVFLTEENITDANDDVTDDDSEDLPASTDAPIVLKNLNLEISDTTEDTIAFEPLHTTDYFASVGIKLSEDTKPTDKLGIQLRSFTDWLKTMKKIHAEQLAGGMQAITEANASNIQSLAEKSNKEDDVLTEAMAEVLLQQGKAGKALEVYKKLSLLNPSKSAYFAAKINQLKEQ